MNWCTVTVWIVSSACSVICWLKYFLMLLCNRTAVEMMPLIVLVIARCITYVWVLCLSFSVQNLLSHLSQVLQQVHSVHATILSAYRTARLESATWARRRLCDSIDASSSQSSSSTALTASGTSSSRTPFIGKMLDWIDRREAMFLFDRRKLGVKVFGAVAVVQDLVSYCLQCFCYGPTRTVLEKLWAGSAFCF